MSILKYLLPQIVLADFTSMLTAAVAGALVAGSYGIVHDQITYTIAPEYFTNLKFVQFDYADFGLGDRVFVSVIGFLATWWVGFISAWILARRMIPQQARHVAWRQIRQGIACIVACALSAGVFAYLYGLWLGANADYSSWAGTFQALNITDQWAFVRVAYIHNAGYLGGLIGLVIALVIIRPRCTSAMAGDHRSATEWRS